MQVKSCKVSCQHKYQIVNTEQPLVDCQQFQQTFHETDEHSTDILNKDGEYNHDSSGLLPCQGRQQRGRMTEV